MSKVKTYQTLTNCQTWEDLRRFSSRTIDDIIDQINGRLSLTENLQTKLVSATFMGSTATVEVTHDLGFVPSGYILVGSTKPVMLYDGVGANTTSQAYLIASGATFPAVARVLFF